MTAVFAGPLGPTGVAPQNIRLCRSDLRQDRCPVVPGHSRWSASCGEHRRAARPQQCRGARAASALPPRRSYAASPRRSTGLPLTFGGRHVGRARPCRRVSRAAAAHQDAAVQGASPRWGRTAPGHAVRRLPEVEARTACGEEWLHQPVRCRPAGRRSPPTEAPVRGRCRMRRRLCGRGLRFGDAAPGAVAGLK